jgi:hypothetical protein
LQDVFHVALPPRIRLHLFLHKVVLSKTSPQYNGEAGKDLNQLQHRFERDVLNHFDCNCGQNGINCGKNGINCGKNGINCGKNGITANTCDA